MVRISNNRICVFEQQMSRAKDFHFLGFEVWECSVRDLDRYMGFRFLVEEEAAGRRAL